MEAARIGSRRAWLPCVTTQRGKCGPWQHIAHAWHTCAHRTYSESQRKPLPGVTAVGFEPTPFRNGALSHRFRPLGQTVLAGAKTDSTSGRHARTQRAPCVLTVRYPRDTSRREAPHMSVVCAHTFSAHFGLRKCSMPILRQHTATVCGVRTSTTTACANDSCGVRTHALSGWRLEQLT